MRFKLEKPIHLKNEEIKELELKTHETLTGLEFLKFFSILNKLLHLNFDIFSSEELQRKVLESLLKPPFFECQLDTILNNISFKDCYLLMTKCQIVAFNAVSFLGLGEQEKENPSIENTSHDIDEKSNASEGHIGQ